MLIFRKMRTPPLPIVLTLLTLLVLAKSHTAKSIRRSLDAESNAEPDGDQIPHQTDIVLKTMTKFFHGKLNKYTGKKLTPAENAFVKEVYNYMLKIEMQKKRKLVDNNYWQLRVG